MSSHDAIALPLLEDLAGEDEIDGGRLAELKCLAGAGGGAWRAFADKYFGGRNLAPGDQVEIRQYFTREAALQRKGASALALREAARTPPADSAAPGGADGRPALLWVSEWIYLPTVGALRQLDDYRSESTAAQAAAPWRPVSAEAAGWMAQELKTRRAAAGRYGIIGVSPGREIAEARLLALFDLREACVLTTLPVEPAAG